MWHWVEPGRGAREAARVLRPGGVLGLLWSGPDRSEDWLAELIAGPGMDTGALATQAKERSRRHRVELPADAPFAPPERTTVRWRETFTAEQLVGLAGTYSGFIVLTEAERARVRAELADFVVNHPLLAGRQELELPMRCHCWRAVPDLSQGMRRSWTAAAPRSCSPDSSDTRAGVTSAQWSPTGHRW